MASNENDEKFLRYLLDNREKLQKILSSSEDEPGPSEQISLDDLASPNALGPGPGASSSNKGSGELRFDFLPPTHRNPEHGPAYAVQDSPFGLPTISQVASKGFQFVPPVLPPFHGNVRMIHPSLAFLSSN